MEEKIRLKQRSIRYVTHHLMVMHPHTNYHWPISKEKNVMARTRKYYLKNNYLTLRSKVKVPWMSLRYVTHRLMVMHIRTICPWSFVGFVWIIWPWGQRSRSHKGHYGTRHTTLWYAPTNQLSLTYLERQNVMAWTRKYYLKNKYLTLRSEVKVPRRSIRYATHRLMCMHPHTKYHWPISKELWSGQASLRKSRRNGRSGRRRKNQTKTICLPLYKGET